MVAFASGKHAKSICDRCGRTIPYIELRKVIVAQRPTGMLVCDECLDVDHPQLMLGRHRIEDPISLRNARPDRPQSQGLARFDPICGMSVTLTAGRLFVSPIDAPVTSEEYIGASIVSSGLSITVMCGAPMAGGEKV